MLYNNTMSMENDSSAERINTLGLELTLKIVEMVRHPKNDISPKFIELVSEESGEEVAEEVKRYGRISSTAYREPTTGAVLYLTRPKTWKRHGQ